jgi:hypothetical protein
MQKSAMILGWLLGVVPWSGVHADSEHDAAIESVKHLGDFQVIELRRYNVKSGERQHFVEYFEAYFPEALEQLGSIVFGQFYDRSAESHFTWLRGFKDIGARPIVSAAFYYGPVWREHRVVVNALFPDAPDNVLLLRPLTPEHAVTVLPAGAIFVAYGESGIREAGELVTPDVANNFPQLPIREDGPFFVWLGIARDEKMVQRFKALARSVEPTLSETGMLRGPIETLVLDPTPRSRLRWLDSE